jgi:hypothetical protein
VALPTLTANSPSSGYIAWTSFSIRYGTVSVTIPAGNTNKRFAYWLWNNGSPAAALVYADVLPALTADDLLVFVNRGGIPVNVTNANVVEGSIIATDSIIGTSIQANTVDASKLLADTITSREIATDAITANELSIASFGGLQAINGEMGDVDPTTKVPAGWTAGFERAGTAPTYAAETAAPLSGDTSVKITVPANSTEGMAATATSCKAGDLISFGVACRASVVGAPITVRAYFGTSKNFTRAQLISGTPDAPTNVVVYDVTATGLVARSNGPTPLSGAGIAAAVDGWPAPVTTSLFIVGQVKVPAGATYVRFVLASGLTASSPAHTMIWDSLEYAPIVTSVKIADGAISARSLAADAIDGKVITGALFRSAATGARWELGTGTGWTGSTRTLISYTGRSDETAPGSLEGDTTGSLAIKSSKFTGQPNPAFLKVGPGFSSGETPIDGGLIYGYAQQVELDASSYTTATNGWSEVRHNVDAGGPGTTGTRGRVYLTHRAAGSTAAGAATGTSHYIYGKSSSYALLVDDDSAVDTATRLTVTKDTVKIATSYNKWSMDMGVGIGWKVYDGSGASSTVLQVASNGVFVTGPLSVTQPIALSGQDWISPGAMGGGWVNFGSGYEGFGYRKMPDGSVRLRGLIKSGATGVGNPVFNLPVGFRPAAHQIMLGAASGGVADIRVYSTGDVVVNGYFAGGGNGSVSFGMIAFMPA